MRKLKLFLSLLMVMLLSIGQMWAADVTFTPGTETGATSVTKSGVTCTMTTMNNASYYQIYANQSGTFSVASGNITKIEFTCTASGTSKYGPGNASANVGSYSYSGTKGTWTGEASSVTISSTAQIRMTALTITVSTSSSEKTLSASPAVIDFGTVEQGTTGLAESVEVTYANLTGPVTYSGLSDAFSASGSINASGDEITIEANTATIGEYEQTLTVTSANDSKSADVTVRMNVVEPFDGLALTFPDYNDKSVSSYTSSWTATKSGQVWTIDNFNNNSNGWSLIKAGRNGNASVASITTQVEDHAVSDVTVTIDGVTASKINSHKLYVADNSSFTGAIEITGAPSTIAAGNIVYTVPVVNRANDLYYKLEFNCASGSSNGFLQISKITYAYAAATPQKDPAGLAYDDADLSNLVKLGDAFTAPTLTNPHSLTVAYESSNTDVAEVASNGALTIKAVGVAEITASSEETDTYKAGSAKYTIYVVAHDGTEADPYTVADARVVIDKVGETGIADKYAKGIVSEIVTPYNSQYGNISYNISDDGTTTAAQLQAFRGKGINGENFTSADDVQVGDEVVVKGLLKKYNNIYEFNADNQLVSLNRTKTAAGLAYVETAIEKNIGDAAFTNVLTNPNNLEVSYSSSATGVATVDENGEVTIVGMGTTTIKATFAGNASYLAEEVSYTLTVNDPSLIKVTFDATIDKASDNAEGITKNGVNIKASHVDGVNNSSNPITYYQCFKNEVFTATCTSGNIKRIEFSCTSSNPASGFGESYADGVWTGDAAIVEITATVKQVQMNTVTVYYKVDARAEAGLAYAETAIEKHVGDDAFVNTLTNPNNLTVAYESSNTDVAEVANDGNVTIKAEGTATITASFGGDEDYKPASVSYELTVNEAGLDNVTFDATIDVAETDELTLSKGGFTLTFTDGAMSNSENYRLYKGQTMTLSSTDYIIKKIEFTCTSDKPIGGFANATGLDKENNRWTGEANKVELTASNAQVRITQMIVYYVEDTRAASGLAWSTDAVEIPLGETFTAASLVNPNNIDAAEITIESSNTNLAIVENGVVSLVEDVTGEATITATFAGNATYKPAEFSYTITVNDPTPMIITNPTTYLNFGSVAQNALVNAKNLEVTLQNVAAATVSITGDGASAFSATPMTLTESGTIVVSASSDTQGTFSATLTISDDANGAESKEISLSLTVTEPVVEETAVSTTSKWVAATDADLVDGAEVLITGVKESATYAMGVQNNNNRAAVLASVDGEGILTPGEGTMSFILEDQGDGTFALRTSNGKYLYAASSSSNYLKTRDAIGDDSNANWTLTATSAIANGDNTNETVRFNSGNNPKIFSCYADESKQSAIALYVPQVVEPVYETVRENLEPNRYYTVCLPKKMIEVRGASFWTLSSRNTAETEAYLEEVDPTTAEAGTPFIIQATDTKLEVVYTGAATTTAGTNGALHGTLTYMDADALAAAGTNIYMLYNNALRPVGTNNHLDANRAYIDYDALNPVTEAPQPAPGRRVRAVPMQQNTATGIDELNGSEAPAKVLINGQLFILRGEKMYDAKGLLVK